MLPRHVAKGKGKEKAAEGSKVSDSVETADVAAPLSDPGPSSPRPDKREDELDDDERERLEDVKYEAEVALSDWGLARFPDLLEAVKADAEAFVPLALLISCPALKVLHAEAADIARVLQETPSDLVELSPDATKIRRKNTLNQTALDCTLAQWAGMTLYLENIPGSGQRSPTTPSSVRAFLSELFGTAVQTVRFPPLYNRDASREERSSSGDVSLYESHPAYKDLDKNARRAQRMPEDGGPFKGFAFVVLADEEAAERILREWPFKREEGLAPSSAGVDGSADREGSPAGSEEGEPQEKGKQVLTPLERARRNGLKAMKLTDWNVLRATYLSYKRALEKLEDDYEERDWREKERRRDRDRYDRNTKRRDDGFWSAKPKSRYPDEEPEEPARPSDADRWGHRSPSPVAAAEERIPGALVQLRNVNRSGRPVAIKNALTALLAKEKPDVGSVLHVDRAGDSIRATVRCSSAEAAAALVELFSGDPRMHSDPYGEDEDAFELMGPMDEAPSVRAALLKDDEEKAYWAEASRHAVNGERDERRGDNRKRGDRFDRPKSKHMRFD